MTTAELHVLRDEITEHIRTNVRDFMTLRGVTIAEMAEATGLEYHQVQARVSASSSPKKRADWRTGELALVARRLGIPEFVFFMHPDDAFATWITAGLAKRPSSWNVELAGQAA